MVTLLIDMCRTDSCIAPLRLAANMPVTASGLIPESFRDVTMLLLQSDIELPAGASLRGEFRLRSAIKF
jgi:hypothetical protein